MLKGRKEELSKWTISKGSFYEEKSTGIVGKGIKIKNTKIKGDKITHYRKQFCE